MANPGMPGVFEAFPPMPVLNTHVGFAVHPCTHISSSAIDSTISALASHPGGLLLTDGGGHTDRMNKQQHEDALQNAARSGDALCRAALMYSSTLQQLDSQRVSTILANVYGAKEVGGVLCCGDVCMISGLQH